MESIHRLNGGIMCGFLSYFLSSLHDLDKSSVEYIRNLTKYYGIFLGTMSLTFFY